MPCALVRQHRKALTGMANVWWVNQGATYDQERKCGYVWARTNSKAGYPLEHHVNVSKLVPGDTIIHYANGAIRSVSAVTENAGVHERPAELPTEAWGREGYLARVDSP